MTRPEGATVPDASKVRGPVHWLGRVAERAGVPSEDLPDVPPGTPTQDAWPVFTRSMGIDDPALSKLVAEYFRLEVANLDLVDPATAARVTEDMARKYLIYPVRESDRHMIVATCDPTDVEAERSLGFTSGRTTVFHVATPGAIQDAIDARFSPDRAVESILGSLEEETLDSVKLIEDRGPESVSAEDAKATPVVKLTNLIIQDGIQASASDIHIEPGRGTGNVRIRVDGVLRQHMEIPMSAHNRVISRIKILSKLDIADRLRPQDGKARVRIKNLAYDLRVSTIPTAGSEKCVIRILDSNKAFTLEDLELPRQELAGFRELLSFRDGIVLVTGPTGSGKTTTLYGALHELATGAVNIMTVEDPVEYDLPAITQTQVETRQSVTFSSALRAILRQDPDVILVGEIRDRETAETAAQAAMTGHLVLATVHANDAVCRRGAPRRPGSAVQHDLDFAPGGHRSATGSKGVRRLRGVGERQSHVRRTTAVRSVRSGAGRTRGGVYGVRLHGLPGAAADHGKSWRSGRSSKRPSTCERDTRRCTHSPCRAG